MTGQPEPEERSALAAIRLEVTDDQRKVLETLRDLYLQSGYWPTHGYLELHLEDEGIELDDELGTMPEGMYFPDKRRGGGAVLVQENERVGLRVLGLAVCRGTERELQLLLAAIRWGVAARRSVKRAPHAPAEMTWRAADIMSAMEREVGAPLRAGEAKLVIELMRDEGGLPRWGGVPDDFPDWNIQIPQDIRRFRTVVTIDDYLALTVPRPRELGAVPTDVTSGASTPGVDDGGGETAPARPSLHVLRLLHDALSALDAGEPVSACLLRSLRIARLAGDLEAVYWLELEQRRVGAESEKEDIGREVQALRAKPSWVATHTAALDRYIERRSFGSAETGEDMTLTLSVAELESITRWSEAERAAPDARVTFHAAIAILGRVRSAVHRYLSRMEQRLSTASPHEAEAIALVSGIDARLVGAAHSLESGQLDAAVHDAFKRVEIAIREAGSFRPDLVGLDLVTEAFRVPGGNKEVGALTDPHRPPAEQEAQLAVFRGAMGLFRNPASHRDSFEDPRDVARLLLHAETLLAMVDAVATRTQSA